MTRPRKARPFPSCKFQLAHNPTLRAQTNLEGTSHTSRKEKYLPLASLQVHSLHSRFWLRGHHIHLLAQAELYLEVREASSARVRDTDFYPDRIRQSTRSSFTVAPTH